MTRKQSWLLWYVVAAAMMVIGSFGPWITSVFGSVYGTDGRNDGWIVIGAAAFAALFQRGGRLAGLFLLIGGAAGAYTTIHDRMNMTEKIDKDPQLAALVSVGWGLDLAMVGSIVMVVGAVVYLATERVQVLGSNDGIVERRKL